MYKIGDILEGEITGLQPYGAFVSLDDTYQGLIHVSEVKHGYIKNISEELKVGQVVKVQIIEIDEYTKKISLSLRVFQEAPQIALKKKKYFTNRYKQIGFATIEDNQAQWIDDFFQRMNDVK